MRLDFSAISDVGRVRKDNQDSGYVGPHVVAVCDGVGGAARGDIASSTAIAQLRKLEEAPPGPDTTDSDLLDLVSNALHRAHDRIAELVDENPSLNGTSTTATVALFDGKRVGLGHVGDSRAYLFRDGELSQLTNDHTFVQTLIDEGRITEAEARVHPHKNLILKAIDGIHDLEPDLFVLELQLGDRLLLCSDGTGVLDPGRLADILSSGSPDYAAVELVRASLEAGSSDNVTCLVADLVEGSPDDPATQNTQLLVGAAADMRARRTRSTKLPRTTSLFRGHRAGDTGELEPVRAEIPDEVGFAINSDPVADPESLRYAPLRARAVHVAEPAARPRRGGRRPLGDRRRGVVVEPGPVLRRRAGRHRGHLPRPRRLPARPRPLPALRDHQRRPSTGSRTSRPTRSARASTPPAWPTPTTRWKPGRQDDAAEPEANS